MKIADIIAERTPDWKRLEIDVSWLQSNSRLSAEKDPQSPDPQRITQFARRYRAVCGDLSLAISMRFPANTIAYLHQLIADAHTQMYRSESFRLLQTGRMLVTDVPRRILHDPCTWISFCVFWGLFLGSLLAAYASDDFANSVAGEHVLAQVEDMYSHPIERDTNDQSRAFMTGFYLFNNAGIGLRCFASGIFLGVGSLITLAFNAMFLGTIFGHVLRSPSAPNFITFVTAHGPFELTAVVLSGAAGLRLGWSVIDTKGRTRRESLRSAAPQTLEIASVATILFLFAAYIEGFVSPSSVPYEFKALTAIFSTLLLVGYIAGLGSLANRRQARAT